MTLIVAAILPLLALSLTAGMAELGDRSAARAQAQLAADSAALAAVAEAGPFGSGLPESQARAFAEANGARLVECLCADYATAAQVTVEVDGVVAQARAVFDPAALLPAHDEGGLHPLLRAAVDRLIRASGGAVTLVSGYRSSAEQAALWHDAVKRYGSAEAADDWVARPGGSMHEKGLAVDLGGDLATAVRLIADLGLPLYRPLSHEPWHFELGGSRNL